MLDFCIFGLRMQEQGSIIGVKPGIIQEPGLVDT